MYFLIIIYQTHIYIFTVFPVLVCYVDKKESTVQCLRLRVRYVLLCDFSRL